VAEVRNVADGRDVSLTIPARPDYLVLARLALSAVCRLTPLTAEAANDFVDDGRSLEDESRVNFSFRLLDDRLLMELDGPPSPVPEMERELSRAIIDATVDECAFADESTRLVKYLSDRAE
jgi:hypothetical protein